MTLHLPTVVRAGLLGLTTGARSFSGLAAQVAVTPSLATRQPERALGQRGPKALVGLLAVGELVGDKLPTTPSRLAPPVLAARLGLAAATALLVVRARERPAQAVPAASSAAVPVAVAVAAAASLVSAYLGHAWRGWAADVVGADWPGAVVEDVVALTLAGLATRP